MAKAGVGGTRLRGGTGGGTIGLPRDDLARLAKEPPPAVLAHLPKYPPGDPRGAVIQRAEEHIAQGPPPTPGLATLQEVAEAASSKRSRMKSQR